MAEEIQNEEDHEEDVREADDQQNLDDLTLLNDDGQFIDDGEVNAQVYNDADWEEPNATQSLATIHTGSRPTDAELFTHMVPEGGAISSESEIIPTAETSGQSLPVIDAPELAQEIAATTANEDTAVALDIDPGFTNGDGSENLSITIADIPEGSRLSHAGGDGALQSIPIDGTTATLSADQLNGLIITPPEDFSGSFDLNVSATSTEDDGDDYESTSGTLTVDVAAVADDVVADAPDLSASLGSGSEITGVLSMKPVSYWKLDETGTEKETLVDTIGDNDAQPINHLHSINDEGVFATSAELKGGGTGADQEYIEVANSSDLMTDNGTLTLWFDADEVDGSHALASTGEPGATPNGGFNLSIEDGKLTLEIEDGDGIHQIEGGSIDAGEWNQVSVSWGDDGMHLYLNGEEVAADEGFTGGLNGNDNPWTFGAEQGPAPAPGMRGPDHSDSEGVGMTDFFDGHLDDIAIYGEQITAEEASDLFDSGVFDAMGTIQYPLDISASLTDTDGSETLSISIDGFPADTVLSAGTDNGDGTWSLDAGDLDGLTATVPYAADGFLMTISATATDVGGDTRTTVEIVPFDIRGGGFDAEITGTAGNDMLVGTGTDAETFDAGDGNDKIVAGAGDDSVIAGDGDDRVVAGAGDDTVIAGDGNDTVIGGGGDDIIDGGVGNDIIDGGGGNDHAMGGAGDDLFIFGAGDGSDYFTGGDGWSDTVQLEGIDAGPGAESGWALQVEGDIGYTETETGIEFDEEVAGSITLSDGSELTFDGVEKLEW